MTDRPAEGHPGVAAVDDPAGYYNDPEAIAADKTLSLDQKRRFLDTWTATLRALGARATPEDARMLAAVEAVRAALPGKAASVRR